MVKNAIKFTSQGNIDIKACYNKEIKQLIVHIKDTGQGIEKKEFQHLFSKFGKLSRTADMNNDGIGLGLTIVKQIIDQSGG